MKKNLIIGVCIVMVFSIFISGCQTAAKKPTAPKTKITSSERRVMANNLSQKAEKLPGVKKATIVVSEVNMASDSKDRTMSKEYKGMIVMAGLTLEQNAEEMKVKSQVRQKLLNADKRISQVLVTTDPSLVKRINDVAIGILEGKPLQSFQDDIEEINKKFKSDNPAY